MGAPQWALQQELMGKGVVPLREHALVKISRSHKNRKACNVMEKQYSAVGEGWGGGSGSRRTEDAITFDINIILEIV